MEKKIYPVCKRCGRKLKTDEARERGFGPVCLLKMQTEKKHPLFGGERSAKSNTPVPKQE
jgi:hypothetical protein